MKTNLGYGAGSLSEASAYQFVCTFLLMYLTGVIGMSAERAGSITSIAMLLESVGGVVIGRLSDSSTSRYGRRRPFLLVSVLVLPLVFIGTFSPVPLSGTAQFAYYLVMAALFWTSYSLFYIPYTALGAEITGDYDDRTRLRSTARAFGVAGSFFGSAAPLLLVELLLIRGAGKASAWFATALFVGLFSGGAIFVCWRATRGMEKMGLVIDGKENEQGNAQEQERKESFLAVLKDYWELLRLKPMLILLLSKLVFMTGYTLCISSMIFYMQYKLNLDSGITSTVYMFSIITSAVYTPLIGILALKMGKQWQLVTATLASALGGGVFFLVGIESYGMVLFYVGVFNFAQCSFWQLSNAIFYDVTEADEYVYGKRREGSVTSLQSVTGTLASALAMQVLGVLLKSAGFDGLLSRQPESALRMLDHTFILIPSILLFLSAVILCAYPMSKKRFAALKEAIVLKREGREDLIDKEQIDKLF